MAGRGRRGDDRAALRLGYLIIDSRNAGNRYDLVIAGMIIIGLIGLLLDGLMRLLEGLKVVRWRYAR
jgi:NitT/TauT family transport system permease protein